MNRLAAGNTLLTVPELEQQLKQLERAAGRNQERVTLDFLRITTVQRQQHEKQRQPSNQTLRRCIFFTN